MTQGRVRGPSPSESGFDWTGGYRPIRGLSVFKSPSDTHRSSSDLGHFASSAGARPGTDRSRATRMA